MVCLFISFVHLYRASNLPVVNPKTGRLPGMFSEETYKVVCEHAELLNSAIIYERDLQYNLYVTFFGLMAMSQNVHSTLSCA